MQKIGTDADGGNRLVGTAALQQVPGVAPHGQRVEALRRTLPVLIVLPRQVGRAELVDQFSRPDQPLRVAERKRLQQGGVHKRKDRHTGAETQCKHQPCDEREAWAVPKLAQSEPDVLQRFMEHVRGLLYRDWLHVPGQRVSLTFVMRSRAQPSRRRSDANSSTCKWTACL